MKKFFKKMNIAHSPLFRIICVLCAVATCVLPFAVSASAVKIDRISIWDLPFTSSVSGDTNLVTVNFPLEQMEYIVVLNGVKTQSGKGNSMVSVVLDSASSYRVEFHPLGESTVFDYRDFPAGTAVHMTTQIDGTSIDSWVDSAGIKVCVGYQALDSNFNTLAQRNPLTDGSVNEYIDRPVSASVNLDFPQNTYGVRFKSYVHFKTKDNVAPFNGVNFKLTSFSLQFSVSDLWVTATQNNKLNGVLDDVKTELKNQGTTLNQVLKEQGITNDKLDDVLGEQEETNDKLDNIINGTVDSTLPPDSGVVEDFEKQEDEIMDSVNDGFNTALGVLDDTIVSIMEVLAGFHAISYIFNLFYGLPLIQLVVNFSLVLGLFGAMLGVVNFVGNKFIGKVGGKGKD